MRSAGTTNLVDLTLFGHNLTDKAILVSEHGDRATAVWLPFSKIEVREVDEHGVYEITCPEWLAFNRGLI